ncbi:TonB-dependent receptor domain-containing protein [Flavobacteriaceae bacterium LMO-SS05]
MKFQILVLVCLIISISVFAQNGSGKVIDSENALELSNVVIVNADSTFSTATSSNGRFMLPKADTYLFSKAGYDSKTVSISNDAFIIIQLIAIPEDLNEIIITSNNFKSQLKTLATAISVLSVQDIQNNNSVNMAPILNTVPGVFMHNGTLTTNRITIRGIGSRNLFGTSKIRAYYQDIPLTNGSGTSTIEDIEMSTLGRVEISKGPSSSTYGAGLGGTIELIPYKGKLDEFSVNSTYTFGSFGLQKQLLQANLADLQNTASLTYSNLHSDGYRENNQTDRQTFTVASQHFLGESNQLTFIGNYTDLKAFIPSSINEDAYLNSPKSAAFTWKRSKGYEDYQKGLFGLSWQHEYSQQTKHYTSLFTSFQNSYEPRPFNVLQEKTRGIGLRSRVVSEFKVFGKSLEWTLGGELFKDHNTYQTYENLYQDYPPEAGSVQGDVLSDFKENRRYFNLFLDSKYQLSKNTIFTFGLNFNSTSYTLKDRLMRDGADFSGQYSFDKILSPKLGLTHQIAKNIMVYTTVGHGFSPPSLEETLLPDGLINTNIKPESGWNYEIGSRGSLFANHLHFDIALYRMDVKNLLVARRTASDEFIGVNAGKTQYNGLEFAMEYSLLKSKNLTINHSNSLTYNNFKFKDFIDDMADYSENDLTGVPNLSFYSNLNMKTLLGFYVLLNYNYVGKIPIRDDNTVYSDSYKLMNTKFGFKSDTEKKVQFDAFVGFNNIFDEQYASMLLINAEGFGGTAPRYYYPGEPSNYYAGLNLKYVL